MSPEITKQEFKNLKKPDEFVGFFQNHFYQMDRYRKHIAIGLVVVLVLIGAGFSIQALRIRNDQSNANDFAKALEKLPVATSKDATSWKTFLDQIDQYITKHSNAMNIPIATLYKAKAQFSLKQYDQALASYKVADEKLSAPYQYLAQEGEGMTQMELTHWDQAATIWKQLSEKTDNPLRDFHLYNLALVQEQLGQNSTISRYV